ncbi:hypothetical protein DFH11DRAFT_308655 [Phellopilus nigrolimitatus]|nr:hypothetical protein DFH11DRAFT_308655 [Phellopilus nigrolimitatus]
MAYDQDLIICVSAYLSIWLVSSPLRWDKYSSLVALLSCRVARTSRISFSLYIGSYLLLMRCACSVRYRVDRQAKSSSSKSGSVTSITELAGEPWSGRNRYSSLDAKCIDGRRMEECALVLFIQMDASAGYMRNAMISKLYGMMQMSCDANSTAMFNGQSQGRVYVSRRTCLFEFKV